MSGPNDVYVCDQRERPGRKTPSASTVARHWRGDPHERFRCWRCDHGCRPDKAHLVDRMLGGLDGPQNIYLLCPECHHGMPMFAPGQELAAIGWASRDDWLRYLAVIARRYVRSGRPPIRRHDAVDDDAMHDAKCWTPDDLDLMVNLGLSVKDELDAAVRDAGWMQDQQLTLFAVAA